jgi:hypothetical protein
MTAYSKLLEAADDGPLTGARRDLALAVLRVAAVYCQVPDPPNLDSSLKLRRLEYDLDAALDSGDEERLKRATRRWRDEAIGRLVATLE